ncbi:hypothetical protein TNCV_234341 [Trichonephila clavipes]|uniref:Uncharacterized protein n=1 Tax=Trichonephila clavipes TaxID=2585209 RepID=A0A8X6VJA1_TRICX|nr:hypothetical protein TNCV_234341 [Trichonephila clavipes]
MGRELGVARSLFVAWDTLTGHRALSPLLRLLVKEERYGDPDYLQSVLIPNWGETEPKHTVTCMLFKATDNDMSTSTLCQYRFRGPSSDNIRLAGLEATITCF